MANKKVLTRSVTKSWTVVGLFVLAGISYFTVPVVAENVNQALTVLSMGDVQELKLYLLSFGIWAPGISALLMVLQAVISPLPAFIISLANGMLFGVWWGCLLSWSTALLAALVCFFIAEALGRPVVERLVGQRSLQIADHFFEKYGTYAVFAARLIPIVPFDPISYGAGLTRMSRKEFILATALGMLPATILYSWLGGHMGEAKIWLWALILISVLLAGSLVFRFMICKRIAVSVERTASEANPRQ